MSKNTMYKISFSGNPLKEFTDSKKMLAIEKPCLYFLCEKDSKSPFYIGEYGKSTTYDVVTRIKCRFRNSGTLARVSNNMRAFGYEVPSEFDAYIKVLLKKYQNVCYRESLEAWIIHKICHNKKAQSSTFCVAKHTAPKHPLSKEADKIIDEFENYS